MSEQQKPMGYQQELNQWIKDEIVHPLMYGDPDEDPNARTWDEIVDQVHEAIRKKILESYRNGQKAGFAKPAGKEPRYAQPKTR